ncbi:hypothetical protein V2S66_26530 [Streptomyces sp. V4-01]|uniref:Transmembrane protein n=1 Tax=Actinacidiphila polyblastidii TaxID=3110430 RepID=A0ABU7PI53_9ACTN|nr:hypothetical protein [Streptomyces sp. V4-01]
MAAGPRDTPQGRDTADAGRAREPHEARPVAEPGATRDSMESLESDEPGDRLEPLEQGDPLGSLESLDSLGSLGRLEPLDPAEGLPPIEDGESFRELRPPRRLRIWQLAPITALAVGGSLMFAFPLAFESGDAGPVVAMLGLLLCCCAAGWGLMAARRLGQTWPGLPPRGSGARPDWRFVAGYTVLIMLLAVLAVWRVARLR